MDTLRGITSMISVALASYVLMEVISYLTGFRASSTLPAVPSLNCRPHCETLWCDKKTDKKTDKNKTKPNTDFPNWSCLSKPQCLIFKRADRPFWLYLVLAILMLPGVSPTPSPLPLELAAYKESDVWVQKYRKKKSCGRQLQVAASSS